MSPAARGGLTALAVALATVVIADLVLQRFCAPLPRRMEVEDGIDLVERGDPETLLLGSSHARSFVPIAEALARASDGQRQLVPVPLEYGKLTGYAWVLDHRLQPLFDEVRDGRPVRTRLARLILVTEWWDACSPGPRLAENIPARAFTWADFLRDFARNGLTAWNGNFIDYRAGELLRGSILYSDRGVDRLRHALFARWHRGSAGDDQEAREADWRTMVEAGATDPACHAPSERAALEHILEWAQARGLDTTLLLFPRKPSTLTPRARATTLAAFSREMQAVARAHGARFIDWTTSSPLTDADFMADLDHVTPEGNEKLKVFGLAGDLRFLLDPPSDARAGLLRGR